MEGERSLAQAFGVEGEERGQAGVCGLAVRGAVG